MDAAELVHVCEKGHADDHHVSIPDGAGQERCSRCGGKTFPIKLDGLARAAIERQLLFGAVEGELAYRERLADRNKSRVHQEAAHRLRSILDQSRICW